MDTPQPDLTVTHTSTVTPDQIDELGHMNVRYYGMNAHAATTAFCAELGLGDPAVRSRYTRHHHEQMEGNELEVRSAVIADGAAAAGGRLCFYHELRNRADDDLAATFVFEVDHPQIEMPGIELPDYGRPRSLRLSADGLAAAPPFEELREHGLAVRLPRTVTTEDSMGADAVPTWLVNNLIWGGERPDGESDWIRELPNGDRFAFAVMESRLWVSGEPVPVGTPIQSFGANVAIADKVVHDVNWCYDTSTGEPIAAMEGVDVCFNMTERRSMSLPDSARARSAETLFPHYAIS